eukprot:CAMPEP_0113943032 /NCGR_PEP_ID=MMETSP1339-20121228/16730_1 /TAXON_ID=94617 /ORGANISM="Fibrocapsa japonica" /LENGTH=221 /DNA_ID=CAMNT_0000947765 /DNA_START=76 /DNA_END=741 /DNA_ORIENTATION=+ /assembly_acc=CAM_ASM_000762
MFSRIIRSPSVRSALRVAAPAFSTSSKSFAQSKGARMIGAAGFASLVAGAGLTTVAACESVPHTGLPGTAHERTFIAVKPDGVQRGLVGEIIARFEKKGYKLVAMKLIWATEEKTKAHYSDLAARPFFGGLVKYFSSGPIVGMVWEGPDAVKTGRKMLGATNPLASDPGTIRGDFCVVVGRNLIHGSDATDSAEKEIANWFTPEECYDWPRTLDAWITEDN